MTKPTMKTKPASARRLSAAWPRFAQKLATVLEELEEDQYLIVSVKRSNRYIQFAAQGSFGMRVETTSNSYLEKPEQLNAQQIASLIDAGWDVPTGDPAEATPENDPDGSPNFFVDFSESTSFEAMANLTVKTFAEILCVPYPGFLQYEARDANGEAIVLPNLGLKRASGASQDMSPAAVSQQLLATLEETTGINDLEFDGDGDIGISFNSALIYVRLLEDQPYVRIFSAILRDVEEHPGIYARLNDINANETLMRFVFRNGAIFGLADISSAPFVGAHITQAFVHFSTIADAMGPLLQEEFGGQTAFYKPMPSLMKH
ncbi:T3SS (YopN, CesT) and YbjN peptide-binding chaperone 1 [Propionivibrio sp.]|uniref:T3SS (YopN, CesT) and YbjN peptide-binding chaperone 1 n=1 Tax=Propionivibrio sp. TaxID=2212460 RepID=UPI003BF2DFD1